MSKRILWLDATSDVLNLTFHLVFIHAYFLLHLACKLQNEIARLNQTTGRPWIRRIRTATTAKTSRMWMNPPSVYELTMPNSQRIKSKTAIVQSIGIPFLKVCVLTTCIRVYADRAA